MTDGLRLEIVKPSMANPEGMSCVCDYVICNGVFLHRAGCPNEGKEWDSGKREWVGHSEGIQAPASR